MRGVQALPLAGAISAAAPDHRRAQLSICGAAVACERVSNVQSVAASLIPINKLRVVEIA